LYFGIDSTTLVQEAFTARDGIITRVEVLGGKFLYAIQIHITGESYNLCPADICQNTRGEELTRIACPVDAPKSGMKVEGYDPPRTVIEDVERIVELAGVEVGGIGVRSRRPYRAADVLRRERAFEFRGGSRARCGLQSICAAGGLFDCGSATA